MQAFRVQAQAWIVLVFRDPDRRGLANCIDNVLDERVHLQ